MLLAGITSHYFQAYQGVLDSIVPYRGPRWISSVIVLLLYALRVFLLQGWYIVTYALAIYLLNLFIAFLSPKFDPAGEDDSEIGGLPILLKLPLLAAIQISFFACFVGLFIELTFVCNFFILPSFP